jgi:hypothetical protein
METYTARRMRRLKTAAARHVLKTAVLALAAVSGGCAFFAPPERMVAVHLPETAPHTAYAAAWRGVEYGYELSWYDGTRVQSQSLQGDGDLIPGHHVVLPVTAGASDTVVVVAQPWITTPTGVRITLPSLGAERSGGAAGGGGTTGGGGAAGGGGSGALVLRRPLGEAYRVILSAASAGLDPRLLNLERIAATLAERRYWPQSDVVPLRGAFDAVRFAEALEDATIDRYDLRFAESEVVTYRELRWEDDPTDAQLIWITDEPNDALLHGVVAGEYVVWSIPVIPDIPRYLWRPRGTGSGTAWDHLSIVQDGAGHLRWHLRTEDATPASEDATP